MGYIPDTSVSDLDGETLKILNQLTTVDAHLYAAAVRRFRLSARVAGISLESLVDNNNHIEESDVKRKLPL